MLLVAMAGNRLGCISIAVCEDQSYHVPRRQFQADLQNRGVFAKLHIDLLKINQNKTKNLSCMTSEKSLINLFSPFRMLTEGTGRSPQPFTNLSLLWIHYLYWRLK